MTRRDLGTYQMLWDCPACGTTKLLGLDHRHCPSCGAPQDPTRRYFPPDEDKVAVQDHRYTGADWRCEACDTPNAALAGFCVNCGAPKEGAKEVGRTADCPAANGAESARSALAVGQPPAAAPRRSAFRWPPLVGCIGVGALGAAILAVAMVFLWTKGTVVQVTGHRWERSVEVESLQQVTESAWRDQVPHDASGVSCSRDVRSTTSVPDGEDCRVAQVDNGDGTFREVEECTPRTRDEPVYDERCTFTVPRWRTLDTVTARGEGLLQTPAWPTASFVAGQREGARREAYVVHLATIEGEPFTCGLNDEARWREMAVGSRWRIDQRVLTGGLDCDTLEPTH